MKMSSSTSCFHSSEALNTTNCSGEQLTSQFRRRHHHHHHRRRSHHIHHHHHRRRSHHIHHHHHRRRSHHIHHHHHNYRRHRHRRRHLGVQVGRMGCVTACGGNGNSRNVSCSKPSLHCYKRPREGALYKWLTKSAADAMHKALYK